MKKKQAQILIIDDQDDILLSAKLLLKKHFETIHTANSPRKLVQLLADNAIDVVLLDMNYRIGFEDGREGIHWLKEIKILSPNTVVVLMTAFGKVETAVEGLKSGAFDYVMKPWDNDTLLTVINNAVTKSRKDNKLQTTAVQTARPVFIGHSARIQQAYAIADKVAKTDANILILGENGTGKYVFAEYIHRHSNRKDQPFIHVDLGSLNENIFESELFGYAKGAFTDAKTDTPGRFEAAQGGTVFLDEIGNVPLHLQSKLLQVIQNRTVTRLGEAKARPVDIRIITATNLELKQEVALKNFREDLFYRINTMTVILPALRERKEDIVPLAHFLLEQLTRKYGRDGIRFENRALENMEKHPWNGNIREMENRIERAVILCEDHTITASDLDLTFVAPYDAVPEDLQLSDLEKRTIEKTLVKHDYNISKTAEELGLSRAALYRRIEKFRIATNP